MAIIWLAALSLAVIALPVTLVIAGFAASRLAGQTASRRQGHEYPTGQMLALTYREGPEQWPPAPIVGAP